MYVVTTSASGWLGDLHTSIRIEFADDAKDEAVRSSRIGEKLLDRCCWRLIANRIHEIQGEAVTLAVSRADVIELIWQLREVDGQTN